MTFSVLLQLPHRLFLRFSQWAAVLLPSSSQIMQAEGCWVLSPSRSTPRRLQGDDDRRIQAYRETQDLIQAYRRLIRPHYSPLSL
ncbi:hypothetical protein F5Y05DRAFT_382946 [Hypoxylon sp. FL0543]|nr:hypothetical protein F5Y05DRAFT_382946 [Hypoxylon sp. FL0543]